MYKLKKSQVVILSLFLIIVTATSTFWVSTIVQINAGDKVVISRSELEFYSQMIAQYREIDELRAYIESNFYLEPDNDLLFEGMKKGLFDALDDPYSVFMNADEFQSYLESASGEYPGIGIYVAPNNNNQIEIVAPIEDTPAYRAGLMARDIITAVNGVEYSAETMDEAISNIKGEPGTSVLLTIFRPALSQTLEVEIERAIIDIKVVRSKMIDDTIGYIRLSMFDENSSNEFEKHLIDLINKGAQGLVMDLRQNPGGYLSQSIAISDFLMARDIVVYTESRNGDDEVFYATNKKYDLEVVILIDGGSASASEIVTGALKDHEVATVVGTTSFGKGVVQIVRPFNQEMGFKLTTSQYFTPSGANIHGTGIVPHVYVEMDPSYYELENPSDEDDNQLQTAIEVMKEMLKP